MNAMLQGPISALLRRTPKLLNRIAGTPIRNDRGDAMDAPTQAILRLKKLIRAPVFHELPVKKARALYRAESGLAAVEPPQLANVQTITVPGGDGDRPARLYDPFGGSKPQSELLIYFHGGGFVIGDLKTHDIVCRSIAAQTPCRVLAVDYRLAPEHTWPAAPEDTFAAWRHVHANAADFGADPDRIVLGGDSAGGNLAAVTCLQARDAGEPMPRGQLLIYPGLDFTMAMPSHRTFGEGYYLSAAMIGWFMANYAADPTDPLASPIFAEDLTGLPPAAVISVGFDPLRDEGEAYAKRLEEAGVPTQLRCEGSMIHGFIHLDGVSPGCLAARNRLIDDLRGLFSGP